MTQVAPTALETADRVRRGELSPVAVIQDTLAALDRIEPRLHAFSARADEHALADARRVAADVAAGRDPGPLAGVPVAVKDLIATRGIRTACGSSIYQDWVPDADDVVVTRIRAAGGVVVGKTTVPELAYSATSDNPIGPSTVNPWDPGRTPGGSSSGSAAAVAAGLVPLALGGDGGGSIRIPAALCGVVGVKPSMGRVPAPLDDRRPGVSSWASLEHLGPLARTVADAALLLTAIAGPDGRDRHSLPAAGFDLGPLLRGEAIDLSGLRIAYSPDLGHVRVEPEIAAVVERAVAAFTELGAVVEPVEIDLGGDPARAFRALIALDTDLTGLRALLPEHRDRMSPHVEAMLERQWRAEDFTDAQVVRLRMTRVLADVLARHDLLLTPTTTVPAFPLGELGPAQVAGERVARDAWLSFTYPFNLTGQPATSVPAGTTASGLPVGLQIVGQHLDDVGVLRAAAAFERVRPWADRVPPLSR